MKRCLKVACGKIVFRPRAAYCLSCAEARKRQLLGVHKYITALERKEREHIEEAKDVRRTERILAKCDAERRAKRAASWASK